MNVRIFPSIARGEINAPSSKSIAHRLLIAAALSKGESVIENIGTNEDIKATIACLNKLGAEIKVDGSTAFVKGINFSKRKNNISLFCNESGSTLRFLIPVSLCFYENAEFTGAGRLLERPQTVYEELFSEKGCCLGKELNAIKSRGELKSGVYELRGDVSSQFITGLLFALPLLKGDSEIILTTPLQSAPYVDITIDVLSKFSVEIKKTDKGFYIKGEQAYKPQNLSCEGDWSNAAFLDAFNLLSGNVKVNNLNNESYQGDMVYRGFFSCLDEEKPTFDISNCPDIGPILIASAVIKNGALIKGTNRLKIKESDRGEAMKAELQKLGVNIEIGDDYICVPKCEIKAPKENICCHNDHRIAMSFAVLLSKTGGTLENAECVNKSYPEFFKDIKKLGINYEII